MTTLARFGVRLSTAVDERGPLCVGIDPHPRLLAEWGLPDNADGLDRFGRTVVAAVAGEVAVVKPQSAFFERHGSGGIAALERLLAEAAAAGLLTILDVKRGDIGSTMDGYAEAYLGGSSGLAADAVTLSPYLGFDSLTPALELARRTGRGAFVLARTSNPEGASVQTARGPDGVTVAQAIVDSAAARNAAAAPVGDVGVVVGATGDHGLTLDALNGPILVPGLGAQGATPDDIARRFAGVTGLVLPAASRSILAHGPDPDRLRAAARTLGAQVRSP